MDNNENVLKYSARQSEECEAAAEQKLGEFTKQYPTTTSGDWQTFIIAFRMGWDSKIKEDNKPENRELEKG